MKQIDNDYSKTHKGMVLIGEKDLWIIPHSIPKPFSINTNKSKPQKEQGKQLNEPWAGELHFGYVLFAIIDASISIQQKEWANIRVNLVQKDVAIVLDNQQTHQENFLERSGLGIKCYLIHLII